MLIAASGVAVIGVFAYAIRATAGTAPRPAGPQARRIKRSVTAATVIELAAAFVLPVVVIAAGHSDWVLPSIVITIGPLLLWLDHLVHIPRGRLRASSLVALAVPMPSIAVRASHRTSMRRKVSSQASHRSVARSAADMCAAPRHPVWLTPACRSERSARSHPRGRHAESTLTCR